MGGKLRSTNNYLLLYHPVRNGLPSFAEVFGAATTGIAILDSWPRCAACTIPEVCTHSSIAISSSSSSSRVGTFTWHAAALRCCCCERHGDLATLLEYSLHCPAGQIYCAVCCLQLAAAVFLLVDKMLRQVGPGKKRRSSSIAGSPPPVNNIFLQCTPGTRVIYSRSVQGRDGSTRMGLFEAVVVKTAADRLDDDLDQIKLTAEGQGAWWERTCNVYDILVAPPPPPAAAVVASDGGAALPPMPGAASDGGGAAAAGENGGAAQKPKPVVLCDGFQRTHAPLTSRDQFDRRVELAMGEKARLDQDAACIADERCVRLGAVGTPGVIGLLSHRAGGARSPLVHYQLRSPDGRPANDRFHALSCGLHVVAQQRTPGDHADRNRVTVIPGSFEDKNHG